MTKLLINSFLFVFSAFIGRAQNSPFQIAIEPMTVPGIGGLQSYAWGQDNGKWLIVGGRLDGLHRRQPFAAFDAAGNNTQIFIVDPAGQQSWNASMTSLPVGIQEQLSSTNMQFFQEGDYLYLIGGYGYSTTSVDHITYTNLTAIHVPNVINAIINNSPIAPHFRQITDSKFEVTGGYLNKIGSTFYLTGGQKFIGRYNPMGPNNGPGFIQEYTDAIRKFNLTDDGTTITISHLPEVVDATNLHRRDYNVVPQIMPNGQEGITAFSGVFQISANLPFLNCVNIDNTGHTVNNSFSQYYNHYHCAHFPIYSETANEMHTVFFGGIAQYFDNNGVLTQDNNVPFVNTIARVTRDASGTMSEYKLPIEMPGFLGASSEFIPVENLPSFSNDVLKLDDLTADTTLIGYIYGGINSTAANIFFTNTGTESTANNQIFKVYLLKGDVNGLDELNPQSVGTLQMQVYPNPNDGDFSVYFNLKKASNVILTVHDVNGKLIEKTEMNQLNEGRNAFSKRIRKIEKGGIYFVTLDAGFEKATQKIIVEP